MRTLILLSAAAAVPIPAAVQAQQYAEAAATTDTRDIIVTASPIASAADETPTIVAKVNRETILQNGGASIADSLAQIPGISATGFAAGASRPIIRGMDATRVRILEDGSSSSDVSDIGPDHGIPIDPLSAQSIKPDGSVDVSVDVKNTGSRAGDEVVQLYIHDRVSSVTRPIKELKGFQRVTLQPGEARTVVFHLDHRSLWFWNAQMKRVVEPGDFDIMAGANSADLKTAVLHVEG